jgi:hypothetical protein
MSFQKNLETFQNTKYFPFNVGRKQNQLKNNPEITSIKLTWVDEFVTCSLDFKCIHNKL